MPTKKSSTKQTAQTESREASESNKQSAAQGRVFLIDAMSHIFRAFFAPMSGRLEPLTNSHGQVTQAVFVFTNMLRKLLADEKPDYIAAVFESGVPTFRHESYAEYKSNRAAMPDDLSTQLPFIMRVCEVFNVPMINSPGFEADDVIGTLAVQAAEKGLQAVIVSNDKDMCQLVRDPSVVCMRQNSQNVKRKEPVPPIEWCDERWVENRFGVPPAQIIDLLGLMGDAVDNIPGAPGIGAKGAVQIVQQYGSIENAIARADEIKHKTYRESLKNNQPIILQSKELATIKTDVQVALDLDKLRMREPDRAAAYKLFRELEFKALTREFAEGLSQTEIETAIGITSERRYRIIRRIEDLEGFARGLWDAEHWSFALAEKTDEMKITSGKRKKNARRDAEANADDDTEVALDDAQVETDEERSAEASGTDDTNADAKIDDSKPSNASLFDSILPKPDSLAPLTGIAIARSAGNAAYIDLENFDGDREQAIAALRDLLSNGLLAKSVHDLKRAVALLAPLGIEIEGVTDDTLLAAYLLDPVRGKYNLVDLARDAAGVEPFADAPEGWTQTAWETTEAADFTTQIADVLHGRILEQGLESIYAEIEIPLAPLLYKIEQAGLRVDTKVLGDLSAYLGGELEKLTKKIYKEAGREFKIGSPKQVGEVLEELNISKGRKTSTGQVSTSRAVLDDLATQYELPRLIIEYRELDKLKTVYTDALPSQLAADGRIHSKLNQTVTATGRLSSSDPNLQNIPIRTEQGRRIRRAFVPEEGKIFIAADYSQLELRLLAHITRDPVMLDAYQKGEDIHSRTAELVFGAKTKEELKEARRFAKIVNFAIAYAVEPFGLSARVGISMKEAKKVIDDYYDTYKGVRRFMEEVPVQARQDGFVRSLYGRIRPVPAIQDRNPQVRHRAEREAINMPIQGSASDIVKIAMLRVDEAFRREGLQAQMVMQVHDELLVEAAPDEVERAKELMREAMEHAVELDVPLEVEIGTGANWMEAK